MKPKNYNRQKIISINLKASSGPKFRRRAAGFYTPTQSGLFDILKPVM
jgi:hypothetical protein